MFWKTQPIHHPRHDFYSLSNRSHYVSFYLSDCIQHWMVLNENYFGGFGKWRDEGGV